MGSLWSQTDTFQSFDSGLSAKLSEPGHTEEEKKRREKETKRRKELLVSPLKFERAFSFSKRVLEIEYSNFLSANLDQVRKGLFQLTASTWQRPKEFDIF